nr:MAG TPA: hypothetical protein [Caudoviricetes sp.]
MATGHTMLTSSARCSTALLPRGYSRMWGTSSAFDPRITECPSMSAPARRG